jgi:hypothetical protein
MGGADQFKGSRQDVVDRGLGKILGSRDGELLYVVKERSFRASLLRSEFTSRRTAERLRTVVLVALPSLLNTLSFTKSLRLPG